MLKRKLLVIIIPVLVTSVLVCAGFSAWYFNAGTVSTSAQLGVKVTEMHVTTGALSTNLPETATIVLDQGGASKATDLTEKYLLVLLQEILIHLLILSLLHLQFLLQVLMV